MPTPHAPWYSRDPDYYGERQLEALLQERLSDPDPRTREDARFSLDVLQERRARRYKFRWLPHFSVMALVLGALVLIGLLLD